MRKPIAAVGSSIFFLLAPGTVAGVVPWWLTRWRVETELFTPLRVVGLVMVVAGALVLLHAFTRFVREGAGTPAPVAPTEHLVIGGLYRYVRNPMYLAVVSCILGQALWLGSVRLLAYAAVIAVCFALFVLAYEEPTLARRYGAEYDEYRRTVPAWWPRWRRPS